MTRTIALSRLDLDEANDLRRIPARPPEHRQPGFEEAFDYYTVFYDCFWTPGGRRAVCLGPPLYNLESPVVATVQRALARRLFSRCEVRHLDRNMQIWVAPRASRVEFDGQCFKQRALAIQPSHCELFRSKRVLVTKSKDNDLTWIRDWAIFYVANHGCNAVLIYDNASARYSIEEIHETLSSIAGLETAVVVNWPFKFGPGGGPSWMWDSDFSQYGVMEHARLRFLACADAVVNADIDELVVTRTGESIFDLARRSRTGYLAYPGIMIENATEMNDGDARRHCHYIYRRVLPAHALNKWTLVPSRCPAHAQWCVHLVTEMLPDADVASLVTHRHFKAITTNWKSRRWFLERPSEVHQVDEELVRWMKCFS